MNSGLAIVAAALILAAVVLTSVKRQIDRRNHWEGGHHDWGDGS